MLMIGLCEGIGASFCIALNAHGTGFFYGDLATLAVRLLRRSVRNIFNVYVKKFSIGDL